jgi:hypothetical protein
MFLRVCEHHPSKGVHVASDRGGKKANVTALCGSQLHGVIWLKKSKVTCTACRAEIIRRHQQQAKAKPVSGWTTITPGGQ